MKNNWFLIVIAALFGLALGLVVGSEIGISLADEISRFVRLDVEVTAYSPSPNQTDSSPFTMASGRTATPQEVEQIRFVALSRDLLKQYDIQWGDVLWIGFEVQDKMGPDATNTVDLFMRSIDLARKFGRQERTVIIERKLQ